MEQIADIIADILAAIRPKKGKDGSPTKAAYNLDAAVKADALLKVRALLDAYVLYPELDGAFLARYGG